MSLQNTYAYTPLQPGEIRLLTLYAGQSGEPIRCFIENVHLGRTWADSVYERWRKLPPEEILVDGSSSMLLTRDWDSYYQNARNSIRTDPRSQPIKHVYEAMSYTWGTQIATEIIHIGSEKIYVRPNLHLALNCLRMGSKSRILWIDALCINQDDIPERNIQVSMMGSIYRNAHSTVIWLGAGDSASNLAFDAMNSVDPRGITEQTSTIVALASRDYWKRLWIIQEIYMTPNKIFDKFGRVDKPCNLFVHCGSRLTTWRHFEGACYKIGLGSYYHWQSSSFEELPLERAKYQNAMGFLTICDLMKVGSRPLRSLVQRFGAFGCQDARDRVYGVLAMAQDADDFSSLVDYNKKLETIYLDVMNHVFKDQQHFDGTDETASNLMPFSYRLQELLEQPFWNRSTKLYSRLNPPTLGAIIRKVEMIVHNRISFLSPPIESRRIPERPSPDWQPFGDDLISAFSWQDLCSMLSKWKGLLSEDRACQRVVDLKTNPSSIVDQLRGFSLHNIDSLNRPSPKLRIFVTADGNYGLVPMNAEVGDALCVDTCWSKMDPIAVVRRAKRDTAASIIGRAILPPGQAECYKYST